VRFPLFPALGIPLLAAVFAPGLALPLQAQSVRGWVGTTVRYVQLRPLAVDTVSFDEVTVDENGVPRYEGREVACTPAVECTFWRTEPSDDVVHGSHDLSLTAWGFGVQGLSTTLLLRARSEITGGFTWPRSDDRLDAFLAYAQLVRGGFRVRAGRQEIRSGLGFNSFDGLALRWVPRRRLRVEAYGGRSLARGLREPRNEALEGLQDFVPDQDAYLLGAAVEGEPVAGTAVVGRYQREIWFDRSALVSERASLDVTSSTLPPLRVDASADWDFAFARFGKAHVTLRYPLPGLSLGLEGTVRRYVPYFDLHTIWGFFDPVAYHEVEARTSWSPRPEIGLWASGARRWYEDAHASNFLDVLQPLRSTAWRASSGVGWRPSPEWSAEGTYRLEWANGGFLSSVDLSTRWAPLDWLSLTAMGTALQQFEEFRLGESTALGGGGSAGIELGSRLRLDLGLTVYRLDTEGRRFQADRSWSQLRGWSSLRVDVGGDPGLTGGGP